MVRGFMGSLRGLGLDGTERQHTHCGSWRMARGILSGLIGMRHPCMRVGRETTVERLRVRLKLHTPAEHLFGEFDEGIVATALPIRI